MRFELLRHARNCSDRCIQELVQDELNFKEAVTLLCNFGLAEVDRSLQEKFGSSGYSIHSCVHSWTVSVLNKEWDADLAKLALVCVASEVPSASQKDGWRLQQRILPHAVRQDLETIQGDVPIWPSILLASCMAPVER